MKNNSFVMFLIYFSDYEFSFQIVLVHYCGEKQFKAKVLSSIFLNSFFSIFSFNSRLCSIYFA